MCGIATYVTTNNKQASQLEQLKETENNYDAGITAEDVYKSYEGGEIIKINTADELLKIGSNEQKYINGKIYTFGTNATYELEGDIEFAGDFREVASRIKENNIVINGNDHQIVVTTASGTKEYYTKYSKYYIATNKYGYVLDGLILYYDGIDNAGEESHNQSATTWKDLSGKGNDATISGDCTWKNNSLDIEAGKVGTVTQNTTFSNLKSFTLLVAGNFNKAEKENSIYSRIISTNGNYVGTNEKINGIDFSITSNNELIYSMASNGDSSNNYTWNIDNNQNKNTTITANWNQSTKKLIRTAGDKKSEVTVSKFDNLNCSKVAMGYVRNTTCGLYRYYKVQLYNRSLSDEEMEINNKADKVRFNI